MGQLKNTFKLFVIGIGLLMTSHATAQEPIRPMGYGDWFYEMGGGETYMAYRQVNKTNFNYGVGADWRLFRGCQFDPRGSITDSFSDAQENIYGLANNLVVSARGLITSWGLSKIQESYPTLFNFLMNGAEDLQGKFQVAVKTCRDYQADLQAGRDPAAGWIAYGKSSTWSEYASAGGNPIKAANAIDEQAAERGVAWLDGKKRGGENQSPIRVIGDVVGEGYSHMTDPGRGNSGFSGPVVARKTGPAAAAANTSLLGDNPLGAGVDNPNLIFETQEEAQNWTISVVGERTITVCKGCEKLRTTVGQGLRAKVLQEKDTLSVSMRDALSKANPTLDDLNALSVAHMGLVVTDDMVRSLKALPENERQIFAGKLVSEIALMRVMAKAMTARDLIKTGMQEPNVLANSQAMLELKDARERLNGEIQDMLFEAEVRKKVFSSTALQLSSLSRSRHNSPTLEAVRQVPFSSKPLVDGAVIEGDR